MKCHKGFVVLLSHPSAPVWFCLLNLFYGYLGEGVVPTGYISLHFHIGDVRRGGASYTVKADYSEMSPGFREKKISIDWVCLDAS